MNKRKNLSKNIGSFASLHYSAIRANRVETIFEPQGNDSRPRGSSHSTAVEGKKIATVVGATSPCCAFFKYKELCFKEQETSCL